jgi:hypothetical protein
MRSINGCLGILLVGATAAACSSNKGTEGTNNSTTDGTTGNTTGSTPQFTVDGPDSGNTSTSSRSSSALPAAQDTADGMLAITAAQASALTGGCGTWNQTPQGGGYAILEFVLDISGSMDDPSDPNSANAASKWQVFAQTLPSIYSALPQTFAVGSIYFSVQSQRRSQNQCYSANSHDVPIAVMNGTQLNALDSSVNAVQTGGSTPTYQAWSHGLDLVTAWTPGPNDPPQLATAGRYLVLITDGIPTIGQTSDCTSTSTGIAESEYDAEIGLIAQRGAAAGVKTFVVGVVGSNDPQGSGYDPLYKLSQVAVAGQTEPPGCTPVSGVPLNNDVNPRGSYCHYDLSTSSNLGSDLATALGSIASTMLSCAYVIPPPPAGQTIDPNNTTLVFTDGATGDTKIILRNTSSTCDQGWHFTDSTYTSLEICGTSCNALQANSASSLKLVFNCDTGTVVN